MFEQYKNEMEQQQIAKSSAETVCHKTLRFTLNYRAFCFRIGRTICWYLLESIQSNGDIFENDIPQHRWLFEL